MYIYVLGLQYMPEKEPTNADFSLLSSLPPPTSEIVTDKIPHPSEKCQLKPTIPSEKNITVHGGALNFAETAHNILAYFPVARHNCLSLFCIHLKL